MAGFSGVADLLDCLVALNGVVGTLEGVLAAA